MDCVYQDEDVPVSAECVGVELEDDEGEFEGSDVREVWLGAISLRGEREERGGGSREMGGIFRGLFGGIGWPLIRGLGRLIGTAV